MEKNIEICECTTDGRLKKVSNFPMSMTNDTAKVDYITESISQELFDGVEVLLIDAENLKIRDSTVTRGETGLDACIIHYSLTAWKSWLLISL